MGSPNSIMDAFSNVLKTTFATRFVLGSGLFVFCMVGLRIETACGARFELMTRA